MEYKKKGQKSLEVSFFLCTFATDYPYYQMIDICDVLIDCL